MNLCVAVKRTSSDLRSATSAHLTRRHTRCDVHSRYASKGRKGAQRAPHQWRHQGCRRAHRRCSRLLESNTELLAHPICSKVISAAPRTRPPASIRSYHARGSPQRRRQKVISVPPRTLAQSLTSLLRIPSDDHIADRQLLETAFGSGAEASPDLRRRPSAPASAPIAEEDEAEGEEDAAEAAPSMQLLELPCELLEAVLDACSTRSLIALAPTCRTLRESIDADERWERKALARSVLSSSMAG